MRRRGTNEIFAIACAGNCTGLIVRVSARADQRRVPDSSGHFVCCPTSRSRRGQITVLIQRNGTNSAVSILIGDQKTLPCSAGPVLFCSLHLLQSVPSLLGKKIFLVDQFDPICFGKRF